MRNTWRWLAWWILLFALPVQGYAAAVKLHCVAASQPDAVVSAFAMHAEPAGHGQHAGGHHAGMHHDHAAMADHSTHQLADQSSHQPADQALHDTAGCSACALCCGGLALPSSLAVSPAERASFHYPPGVAAPVTGIVSPLLERPPRALGA